MAAMNASLSFPFHSNTIDHELAIRRFCPARIAQEQGELEDWNDQIWSPYNGVSTTTSMAASEEDELVDSFINNECYEEDGNKSIENRQELDHNFHDNERSNILSMLNEDYGGDIAPNMDGAGVDRGLQLVHGLLACAEAVGCRDIRLAESILRQICSSASRQGDSLQRVSYCFAVGLKSRLSHLQKMNANAKLASVDGINGPLLSKEEKMEAFHLLHQTTPYIAFGFMAANEAIYQAAQGKDSDSDSLHIIDLGMEHCLQWPSLIRTLASNSDRQPPKLRITGLVKYHPDEPSLANLKSSMKSLTEYATTMGVSLELNMVSEPETPSLLTKEMLDIREGEILFMNSIMHLHRYVKESRGSLKAVLQAVKKLQPRVFTVVEQDANHNGPFFLGRFLESLHYYSAIFDSLEASLPRKSEQRTKIEGVHFGEEIRNIVAEEGSERMERHERGEQWRRQLGRAGFQVVGMKSMSQARMMLSVYGCDGYTLAFEKGCLVLGWKGKPIIMASAWQVAKASSS